MPRYSLRVNGRRQQVTCSAERTLLSVLRDELDLTGAKYGCGEGQCGSCTVLLDDEAVPSCVTPVSAVGKRAITSIEGLGVEGKPHPVQKAFLDAGAFQCGFCTPGMILGAVALLRKHPNASAAEIKTALEGHVCRCGTYPRIVQAVRVAALGARRAG
jgi:nicotinate dehydrogenase subunit A